MDKKLPLVAIIINTKGRIRLISRYIEGIQNQTYQSYEHIVADGGTDNMKKIVESYNNPHIIYISIPEDGPVAQTKKAFKSSKGEFITFLDDDDEYTSEELEKQLDLIQSLSDDYGFIYGVMTRYDNSTKGQLNIHGAEIEGGPEVLPIAILKPTICGTPTFMLHRKTFKSIRGTWISGISNDMSDQTLGCRAPKQGWKVAALKEPYLCIYVNHQTTRMNDVDLYKDNSQGYIKLYNHFLSEYTSIVAKNPKVSIFHYGGLVHSYMVADRTDDTLRTWYKLIKTRPNFHPLVSFPYYFFGQLMKR